MIYTFRIEPFIDAFPAFSSTVVTSYKIVDNNGGIAFIGTHSECLGYINYIANNYERLFK